MKNNLILCFLLMSVPQIANSGQTPNVFAHPQLLSNAMLAPLASMHNMLGDRLSIELMPSYWDYTFDGGSTSGLGGAIALKYEFSGQWGIAFLGSEASSGEFSTTKSFFGQQAYFISGKYKVNQSQTIAIALTHDFFSDPDSFRLPFFIGAAFGNASLSGTEQGTFGATVIDNKASGIDLMYGISPEFNVGAFRIEPALVITNSGGNAITWRNPNGSVATQAGKSLNPTAFILGIKYEPLGLAYNYQYYVNADTLVVHSFLLYTKTW